MRSSTRFTTGLAVVAAAVLGLATLPSTVEAATANQNLTINAVVNDRATLTLSTATINFPDSDPETVLSIAASENPVTVSARVRTGATSTPTLTVQANGDLSNGTDTIPISNVTWTASGSPFVAGTMNATVAQSAATFGTGSGSYTGTFSYFLANDWAYNVGTYTATATYTLTAP
ncbi:MAG TPA: hypothetical protein VF406_03135 [Thermodesulfobacteriota bacterium]